jgi:hypothetical protein
MTSIRSIETAIVLVIVLSVVVIIVSLSSYTQRDSYTVGDKIMYIIGIINLSTIAFVLGLKMFFSSADNNNDDPNDMCLCSMATLSMYIYGLLSAGYTVYSLAVGLNNDSDRRSNRTFTVTVQIIGFVFIIIHLGILLKIISHFWAKYFINRREITVNPGVDNAQPSTVINMGEYITGLTAEAAAKGHENINPNFKLVKFVCVICCGEVTEPCLEYCSTNTHTDDDICTACFNQLSKDENPRCPICRGELFNERIKEKIPLSPVTAVDEVAIMATTDLVSGKEVTLREESPHSLILPTELDDDLYYRINANSNHRNSIV